MPPNSLILPTWKQGQEAQHLREINVYKSLAKQKHSSVYKMYTNVRLQTELACKTYDCEEEDEDGQASHLKTFLHLHHMERLNKLIFIPGMEN